MRIGVLCPSEIAIRRFMPALQHIPELEYVGVCVNSAAERYGDCLPSQTAIDRMLEVEKEKAKAFLKSYGGKIFGGYENMVTSNEIDAVYIPLPPALHYRWAKLALENGKHILVEKPSTICVNDTKELISIARKHGLALHENYMFAFHAQLDAIDNIIKAGAIGDVRLFRISFGFPLRAPNDFRYKKSLGGGALIDAGGYTIKYAARLLGDTAKIRCAQMNYIDGYEVDMYGSGTMTNDVDMTAQLAFGMDNNYKCELEAWGSKGCLTTGRVLTAPAGFIPKIIIRNGNTDVVKDLPADDAFGKSILRFCDCIRNKKVREENYYELMQQAQLVDEFRKKAENEL